MPWLEGLESLEGYEYLGADKSWRALLQKGRFKYGYLQLTNFCRASKLNIDYPSSMKSISFPFI